MSELNPDGPAIADSELGIPGDPEPLPEDDALLDEPTSVNDYPDEDDDDE